ncbi:MAG: DUF4446 family protein [Candidatus Pacebacteria bacterium]|nr:DUF4446 family protein [Candidatus Paceibacterota bacterium]MBP9832446.1 DUF4446 family protein [Candidatus Paceibacterota bacterium]
METAHIVLQNVLESVQGNPVLSGLTILVAWALIQDLFLFRRLRRLVRGGDGKTLEGTIRKLQERVSTLEEHATKSTVAFNNVDARLETCIRGIAMRRFDPFGGEGGQQSFIVALLDEKGDGAVLSGIHARDGVRVYAKAVKKFLSERELSEEERGAISDAKKTLLSEKA